MRFFAFWGFIKMNILIVGNGFDLSHYLPTKYDHFMVAMEAIENWDVSKGEMNFDDLFSALYEKEDYFFGYTKAMYKTDEIKMSVDQIKDLQEQLKDNVWYQYFSDHVKEVKTWIDFEQKIEDGLDSVVLCLQQAEKFSLDKNYLKTNIDFEKNSDIEQFFLNRSTCNILKNLGILISDYYDEEYDSDNDRFILHKIYNPEYQSDDNLKFFINEIFLSICYGFNKLDNKKVVKFLFSNLENFIDIFNIYLRDVVDHLTAKSIFNKTLFDSLSFEKIYSFNYTSTFIKLYEEEQDIDFLHGKFGKNQNIVLGISEITHEFLQKLKAYGFTKYHQKILKNTNYLFLDDSTNIFKAIMRGTTVIDTSLKKFNFYIWGHSLDISDQEYIKDLFSFNLEKDQNVKIIIFHFDEPAKYELLGNLLHILGKKKIEQWMKKGWLKFEKNPDIAKINGIEPVELPKMTAQVS